ncbi:MAG TPA: hypothetical protein VMU05_12790 [Dongiaceae bacterium]|nr:hypothetical protein [Dongiaceae bacterium]
MAISEKEAVKTIGALAFTNAQYSARPSPASQFGRQVKQDFIQHPYKQAGIIVGSAAIPVGYVAPLVGAGMSALGIGTAVLDDATHIAPY